MKGLRGYSMHMITSQAVRALHGVTGTSSMGMNISPHLPARFIPAVDAAGAGRCPRALESSQSMSLS